MRATTRTADINFGTVVAAERKDASPGPDNGLQAAKILREGKASESVLVWVKVAEPSLSKSPQLRFLGLAVFRVQAGRECCEQRHGPPVLFFSAGTHACWL